MIDAMKQALEAFEDYQSRMSVEKFDGAITTLRQAIEQAEKESTLQEISDIGREIEQEPVPVGMTCKVWTHGCALFDGIDLPNETLLYTAPPKRKWVQLSTDDIYRAADREHQSTGFVHGALWAEAALWEKNNGN